MFRAALFASMLCLAPGCAAPPDLVLEPPERLPGTTRPLRYALDLEVVPSRRSLVGDATIQLEIDAPVRTVWLHARDLDVSRVLLQPEGDAPSVARWVAFPEEQLAAVVFARPVAGRVSVRIRYEARLDQPLDGAYRVTVGGAAYVFTQFEPVAARSAFPCLDEPGFKAPFELALTVPFADTALANTPIASEETLPTGRRRVRFEPTPPLPTYLVAFAVGPFDVVRGSLPAAPPRTEPVPFRGIAVRGRGEQLRYALDHTAPLLEALERWFEAPYPFRKLDVIAVPDFAAGAMENVGAITFREHYLLIDEENTPEHQLRQFANVMAHELAHSWFGNFVTMRWWDDLWLNEAFATWLAQRIVEEVHPGYRSGLSHLRHVHAAMGADSLVSARRIRQPIRSAHDIANAFDGITYSKGAGVISMFERWIGADAFRAGVGAYVRRHGLGNADTGDLLAALGEASGRDVAGPFETFLEQPGVPFLATEVVCDDAGARLAVTQSRYLPLGSEGDPEARWSIPVCARFGTGEEIRERCALLEEAHAELELGETCPDWLLPNADGAGYYRFGPAADDAKALRLLGWPHLDPPERLSVADSMIAAFRAGATGPEVLMPWLQVLAADPERTVATAPTQLLQLLLEHALDAGTRRAAEQWARALYTPRLKTLGLSSPPDEDGEQRLLRASLIRFLAGPARDPALRADLARRGRARAGLDVRGPGPTDLAPDLAGTALAIAIEGGGPEVFDALDRELGKATDSLERSRILHALGSARAPAEAARARDLVRDPRLRVSEMLIPLRAQLDDPRTRPAAWAYLRDHFESLRERLDRHSAGGLPWTIAGFCQSDVADEAQAFFQPHVASLEGGPRNLAAAIEVVKLCSALVETQGPVTRSWFASPPPERE